MRNFEKTANNSKQSLKPTLEVNSNSIGILSYLQSIGFFKTIFNIIKC